eukprot:9646775-Ditylum_brightwellii.AAC.1
MLRPATGCALVVGYAVGGHAVLSVPRLVGAREDAAEMSGGYCKCDISCPMAEVLDSRSLSKPAIDWCWEESDVLRQEFFNLMCRCMGGQYLRLRRVSAREDIIFIL